MAMRGSTLLLLSQNLRDLHDETIVRMCVLVLYGRDGPLALYSRLVVDEEPSPLDVKLGFIFQQKACFLLRLRLMKLSIGEAEARQHGSTACQVSSIEAELSITIINQDETARHSTC